MGIFDAISTKHHVDAVPEMPQNLVDPEPVQAEAETALNNEIETTPPEPQPRYCKMCFLQPSKWVEKPSQYPGRVSVECGECGRFIGYRTKQQEKANKPRKMPSEKLSDSLFS